METLILNWLMIVGTGFGIGIGFIIIMSLIVWENAFKVMGFWFAFRICLLITAIAILNFKDHLFVWS